MTSVDDEWENFINMQHSNKTVKSNNTKHINTNDSVGNCVDNNISLVSRPVCDDLYISTKTIL